MMPDVFHVVGQTVLFISLAGMGLTAGRWAGATLAARLVQYAQRRLQGR